MIATDRLFAMPTFEGLREIRRHLLDRPNASLAEAVAAIKATEADAMSLDLEASCELHLIVEHCEIHGHVFYRHCIRAVLLSRYPIWVKTMRLGRQVFAAKLDQDNHAIFENAGLLESPPSNDVVEWWDKIGHEVKLESDLAKMAQARKAEKLSLMHEKTRLQKLGIDREPIWVGLDDNTAGYDVLSYEPGNPEHVNKLIEVKSTIASPLRFFVTRNEWSKAETFKDAYVFHVWDMTKQPEMLHVRTVAEVQPHIPSDNENGKWANAEIPLGA